MTDTNDPNTPKTPLPACRLEKRSTEPRKDTREKVCATCGRLFALTPEQKFFDCPECYQRKHPARKAAGRQGTQVLVQIRCAECGISEFLDVQPPDPAKALCRACFARKRRETKDASPARPPKR